MDSHRPIYHANVDFAGPLIIVEESSRLTDCPTRLEMEEAQAVDPDEEEALYDGTDREAEKENLVVDELEDEDEALDFQIGKKRAAKLMSQKRQKQKLREEKKTKIENYYSGSYFSDSISGIAYFLSRQLNQDTADFFWYWILGATEMLIDKKISFNTYKEIFETCKIERNRFASKSSILNDCKSSLPSRSIGFSQ